MPASGRCALPAPDYGAAMKAGMLAGRGDLVVNFDIDFHDVDFLVKAGECLATARLRRRRDRRGLRRPGPGGPAPGIVVGSKLVEGADDRRSRGAAPHLARLHHHPARACSTDAWTTLTA